MAPRTKKRVLIAVVGSIGVLLAIGYGWFRCRYPYGFSHCCDMILFMTLNDYAARHDGAFPAGEATPEASMSLLYREKQEDGSRLADEQLLHGKSVPESVVKEILERGELLTPETCGWHYVDGLRRDDDPRLALFWDKAGLDHMGGRLAEGGHIVTFIDGQRKHVPEAEWAQFLEEQRKLLAIRGTDAEIRRDATLPVGSRNVRVQVRVIDGTVWGACWDGGSSSGRHLATTAEPTLDAQDPVIPAQEIKDAKIVVEPELGRVRFVLVGREIVYRQSSGFCVETDRSGNAEPRP